MSKIWFTSDLHFGHDREFLWGPRGFENIQEHDEVIIEKWNSVVDKEDDVYVLGDLMLNDNVNGLSCLRQLNGKLHIVYGNHDTDARIKLYQDSGFDCIGYATLIKYKGYHFYLSHFPTLTTNTNDNDKSLKAHIINICGHKHTKNKFEDMPFGIIYHCETDAHNCTPILIDTIIEDIIEYWTN